MAPIKTAFSQWGYTERTLQSPCNKEESNSHFLLDTRDSDAIPDVLPVVEPGGAVAHAPIICRQEKSTPSAVRTTGRLRPGQEYVGLEGARARDHDRGHARRRLPERPLNYRAQSAHEAGVRVGWDQRSGVACAAPLLRGPWIVSAGRGCYGRSWRQVA
ncbi:hypothetical protein DL770_001406 [Monosporascus sp. CRB-9-2]|nr:hypothetical protein DL770_001406 [Monosporascus sp. CRB-9-2]